MTLDPVGENDVFLNNQIPGYISNAFDLNVDGEIGSAVLSFEFDEALLNDTNFEPAIYYFDEEAQFLVELENQTITGNTISVEFGHFSKYVLLNKKEYGDVWRYTFLYDNTQSSYTDLDVVFVTDISLSMDYNDSNGIRNTATKSFIDNLNFNDRAALITYRRIAEVQAELTTDKASVKSAIDAIVNDDGNTDYSGTNGTAGIKSALDMFDSNRRTSAKKIIVFLTDGQDNYISYDYDYLIDKAKEKIF